METGKLILFWSLTALVMMLLCVHVPSQDYLDGNLVPIATLEETLPLEALDHHQHSGSEAAIAAAELAAGRGPLAANFKTSPHGSNSHPMNILRV